MNVTGLFRKLLSAALTAVLFLSFVCPAAQATVSDAAEATLPAEAVPSAVPAEAPSEPVAPEGPHAEETAPAETVPVEAVAPETAPAETIPDETAPDQSLPAETLPEETAPEASQPPEAQVQVMTIAQACAMAVGTGGITIRGTVVYAREGQAVLQDATGGIRVFFEADPEAVPGEILQVTGTRTRGLAVQDFESLGTGPLPVVKTTMAAAPESLRVQVLGCLAQGDQLVRGDLSLSLSGTVPETLQPGSWAEVTGVILAGILYADTIVPAQAPEEETEAASLSHWFGQLHAHVGLGGVKTPAEAYALARAEGMAFFAVTDYSDSLYTNDPGSIGILEPEISPRWAQGKADAQAASTDTFLALYAYEMNWPADLSLGHINTFFTPGWLYWQQCLSLEDYCDALSTVSGSVSMFCHPGHDYGNFRRFSEYTPDYDQVMHLIELGSGEDMLEYYDMALLKGWHLAPVLGEGQGRAAVLAESLSEESLSAAIRSCRVYATEDTDLEITYTLNGMPMGSTVGLSETLEAQVVLLDPSDSGPVTVEVMAEGSSVTGGTLKTASGTLTLELPGGYDWYYLRLTQNDQDVAITAPIWVDNYQDIGIRSFAADEPNPLQEEAATLTLTLYNEEAVPFQLEALEFYQDGILLHSMQIPTQIPAGGTLPYHFAHSWTETGLVSITAVATGTIAGNVREFTQRMTLYIQERELPLSSVWEVRTGNPGTSYRINAYITAGTDNTYNQFSDGICLQDDTGGIAVTGDFPPGLQVGQPLEVVGILRETENGCRVLAMTEYTPVSGGYYRYEPKQLSNSEAMDYDSHGGELLQIEGKVVSLVETPDGNGISSVTIQDSENQLATAVIESNIRSGSYGTNELAAKIRKGRTVRIIGLLHRDESGEVVLRVRNCDEVVYVPAKADPSNPKTGDCLWSYWWKKLTATLHGPGE